jgi:hypothetical protein
MERIVGLLVPPTWTKKNRGNIGAGRPTTRSRAG